jgi:hypothetical protein
MIYDLCSPMLLFIHNYYFCIKSSNSMDEHPQNTICDFSMDQVLMMKFMDQKVHE